MELGLGYLALDRAGSTLSTGERQRVQLARAVRNRTTGVLYVLDEPSIGLHPSNIDGPAATSCATLLADGNSVVLVDHDTQHAAGGRLDHRDGSRRGAQTAAPWSCQGAVDEVRTQPRLAHRPVFRAKAARCPRARERRRPPACSTKGRIRLSTAPMHTVHAARPGAARWAG